MLWLERKASIHGYVYVQARTLPTQQATLRPTDRRSTKGDSGTFGSTSKLHERIQRRGNASSSAGQRSHGLNSTPSVGKASKLGATSTSRPPTSPPYRPRIAAFRPSSREHRCRPDWGILQDVEATSQRCSRNVSCSQHRGVSRDLYNLYTDCSGIPGKLYDCVPCSSSQYWRSAFGLEPTGGMHVCITEQIPRHMVKRMQASGTAFCVSRPRENSGSVGAWSCPTRGEGGTHRSSLCEQAALSRLRAQVQCSRVHKSMETARALLEERSALLSS